MNATGHKKRALVVDDDEATLFGLRSQLRNYGLHVDTATGLTRAEALLDQTRYDVVIADLRLTGSRGEEGLRILAVARQRQSGAGLILMTAYGIPDIERAARETGAACFLEKPVSAADLRSALQRIGIGLGPSGNGGVLRAACL